MKRFIIIIIILVFNFSYYAELASAWNTLTVDGGVGRSVMGLFLSILSFITINNLNEKIR